MLKNNVICIINEYENFDRKLVERGSLCILLRQSGGPLTNTEKKWVEIIRAAGAYAVCCCETFEVMTAIRWYMEEVKHGVSL